MMLRLMPLAYCSGRIVQLLLLEGPLFHDCCLFDRKQLPALLPRLWPYRLLLLAHQWNIK
jgi:hypothetical protein